MRGGFVHVLAFAQVDNWVQVIDPVATHVQIELRRAQDPAVIIPAELIALDFAYHGGTVVRIDFPISRTLTSHHLTNWFPGCVTLAKNLLGVAEWVFTPNQFYHWLLENGGQALSTEDYLEIETLHFGHPLSIAEQEMIFSMAQKGRIRWQNRHRQTTRQSG
jgi:hypothetical protein